MAFDQPIEADKPDDLGFISSFIRAPVVGTIMWLFGGKEAMKQEKEEERLSIRGVSPQTAMGGDATDFVPLAQAPFNVDEIDSSSSSSSSSHRSELPELASSLREGSRPSCVDSDVSDEENAFSDALTDSSITPPLAQFVARKGTLSWSDQLVEYLDKVCVSVVC